MDPRFSGAVFGAPAGGDAVDRTRIGATERARRARTDLVRLAELVADEMPAGGMAVDVSADLARAIRAEDHALVLTLEGADETPSAELWKTVRMHQARVDAIATECVEVVSGVRLRENGADGGICAVADRLLQEVMEELPLSRTALTVPGGEDRTSYISGAIGMRLVDSDVWSLPVVLHELGHVLAQSLDTSDPGRPPYNPIRSILKSEGSEQNREELWADYFATYAIGAAYPAVMVWYRFDPADSKPDVVFEGSATTATHPPVDKRVHLMLDALRTLDGEAGKFQHPYRAQTNAISAAWTGQAASLGTRVDIDAESAARLGALARQFGRVARESLVGAKHRVTIADELEDYLLTGRKAPPASTTLRDVVSAAWRLRLAGSDVDDVARHANALTSAIIGGQ